MQSKLVFNKAFWGSLLFVLLLLSACGPTTTPTSAAEYIATQVEATFQAQATLDMAETLSPA